MFKLRPYQDDAVTAAIDFFKGKDKKNAIEVLPTGCHALDHLILMKDGTLKKVQDIEIGDSLMGVNSESRKVLQLIKGKGKMYKIIPISSESFDVNEDHILHLRRTNIETVKNPSKKGNIDKTYPKEINVSVKEYLLWAKSRKHLYKLISSGCEYPKVKTNLSPYFVGLWLAKGNKTLHQLPALTINSSDLELLNWLKSYGSTYHKKIENKNCYKVAFTKKGTYNRGFPNPIETELKKCIYGIQDVGIPDEYLINSYENRLELLAGLLDGDGCLQNKGFEIISKYWRLAQDIQRLVRSVGLKSYTSLKYVNNVKYYRINISGNCYLIPNKLLRKKSTERKQIKNVLMQGFKIEPLLISDFYGFMLDGNHLYLDGNHIIHHNSGKSLVLANIVKKLGEPTLILQPTKEILEQNFDKLLSYQFNPSIYSASLKKKEVSEITLATIGSIVNKPELFHQFKYLLIDECDTVNPKGGMYERFINSSNFKILGVTATPYRLSTDGFGGSMLKFITRTRPKVFDQMIYYIQNKELFDAGFLSKLKYFSISGFDSSKLKPNTTGADYDELSVQNYYTQINFPASIVRVVKSLMGVRKNVLVFTRFVSEAEFLVQTVPGVVIVTADTPKKERERILTEFKLGIIKVVANVGILSVGFDYPELETVVIARPTMSLRLWYQMIGRSTRPHDSKEESYVVDMGDNLRLFGRVEDMIIENEGGNKWFISSNGKKLTNQYYER